MSIKGILAAVAATAICFGAKADGDVTYIEISDVAGFNAIANNLATNYILTADIDLNGVTRQPFGTFTGILDGGGHTIRNLDIKYNANNCGLFSILDGATVRNLTLEDGEVGVANSTRSDVGGIAGRVNNGALIENCTVAGLEIVAGASTAGGLVGYAASGEITIRRCRSFARVVARTNNDGAAGGLVGYVDGTLKIEDSYSAGVVTAGGFAGGLVGRKYWGSIAISNCYHKSYLSPNTNNDRKFVGGGDVHATITDVPTVIDSLPKGGIHVYSIGNGTGTAAYANGGITATPAAGSFVARQFGELPEENEFNDVAVLVVFGKDISTAAELKTINPAYSYRLTQDIDLQNEQIAPFGNFSGVFDGGSNTIRNLNIRRTDNGYGTALFQTLNNDAIVRNLTLEGGTVRCTGNYQYPMGGIAGYVHGSAFIEDCTVDLDIAGSDYVGGLVGRAEIGGKLTIRRCRSFANVTSSGNNAGGLIGSTYSTSVIIEDSYSSGKIVANNNSGGLIGEGSGTLTISNCYQRSYIIGNFNSDRKLVGNGDSRATITGNPTIIDTMPKGGVRVKATGSGTGTTSYDAVTGEITATPAANSYFVERVGEVPGGEFNDLSIYAVFGKYIATVADYNSIANNLSGHYTLTADLDFQNVARAPLGEFKGVLDGDGHTISNIYINSGSDGIGLFRFMNGATVRNLTLRGGKIYGNNVDYNCSGGIAGYVSGVNLIEDCTVDLEIHAYGYRRGWAGGIAGHVNNNSSLTIRRCRSLCAITGHDAWADGRTGGLVGSEDEANLTIENCYVAGSVQGAGYIGGILGYKMRGTVVISNSYWTADVRGNYNADTHTVGRAEEDCTIIDTPAILDGFAKNTFIVRTRGNGTGTAAYVNGEFVATPAAGSVFIRWEGLPPEEGDYNETTVWAVFGEQVASLNRLKSMDRIGFYVQTADIDMTDVKDYSGITAFRFFGYYDGANHEILNMSCHGGGGLFDGLINAEVKNLRLVEPMVGTNSYGVKGTLARTATSSYISNIHVEGGSTVARDNSSVGGLVGDINGGLVEDCSTSASVANETTWDAGAGGFVGNAQGNATIRRCRATGDVTTRGSDAGGFVGSNSSALITECYATGNVVAENTNAGGFVGYEKYGDLISNCYALGTVSATNGVAGGFAGYAYMANYTNCFSAGEVTVGSGDIAGFGKQNYLDDFGGCCWDTDTSGLDTASGAGDVGKTTAQMQSGVAFEGWDTNVWKFSEGKYPRLRAFIPKFTVTWLDDDGTTVLGEEVLDEDDIPAYSGEVPSKAEDTFNVYMFSGWTPDVAAIESNTTYTAVYTLTPKWTGTGTAGDPYVLITSARITEIIVLYGESVPDEIYVSTGNGITAESLAALLPAGYAVRATGAANVVKIVKIVSVVWRNHDGTVLERDDDVAIGTMPSYDGATPTKASTAQYDYTFAGWTPSVVTVTGSAEYTATYTETLRSYTITWLDADGTSLGTTSVEYGATPSHAAPTSVYTFSGWSPAIAAVSGDATYTATYSNEVVLNNLTSDYTAAAGDVLTGTTAHNVSIPGGATVTINGVSVTGAGGGASNPTPSFGTDGDAVTTKFTQGANGKWTVTAFAELENDAVGADVANGQIKVYAADTLEGLDSAAPMSSGVEVKEKKSAVKTTLEVTPPTGATSQFFRVQFGE